MLKSEKILVMEKTYVNFETKVLNDISPQVSLPCLNFTTAYALWIVLLYESSPKSSVEDL